MARARQKSAPAPTAGADWRTDRQGFVKTLLSGKRARLRAVDVGLLALSGEIPDFLTPMVLKMLFGGEDAEPELDSIEAALGISGDMLPLINLICRAAFVEPRIVDDPQATDEISIDDVALEDRLMVFQLVIQGVEALRRFRYEPAADVGAVPDGKDDEPEAEPVGADSGDVGGAAV